MYAQTMVIYSTVSMNVFQKIIKTINTSADDPLQSQHHYLAYSAGCLVISFVCIITTSLNFYHGYVAMGISTAILMVGFAVTAFLLWKHIYDLAIIIVALLLAFIFTWYAVTGGNFGFAIIWILLVPLIAMTTLGLKIGTLLSLYFQLLLFALFLTPLKQHMAAYYTEIFMERFPFVYLIGFIVSFILQYQLHASRIRLLAHEEELQQAVIEERNRVSEISLQTILSISNAVDAKDRYTQQHSRRVAQYSGMIAEKLGWDEKQVEQIKQIALLHDIGKISISDHILNKPGELSEDEYAAMRTHTEEGSRILKDLTLLPNVAYGARYHHEHYDGSGYPEHLKKDEIPIEGRIIAIADAFDAMNSNRVYRTHLPKETILDELKAHSGTQFDPRLIELFLPVAESIMESED